MRSFEPLTTGARIKAERLGQGVRQAALAKTAGVTPSTLCDIEHDVRQPSWALIQRIARALGCSLDSLKDDR